METLLQKILEALVIIGQSLGAGSRLTDGYTREIAVPNDRPVRALSANPRRTKWQGQNIDAGVIVRYGYSDELRTDRGHRIYNNGGAYTDDAVVPHKGEVWLIAEAAGNPIVIVSEEFYV